MGFKQIESMNKIPTVKIEFHGLPDLILRIEEYNNMGKWNGFLREYHMRAKDIKKLTHLLMKPQDYPTIVWEG